MSEEYFRRKFGEVFGGIENSAPRTLAELVEKSGHARATVIKWLRKFELEGLIERKPIIKGKGRPKFVYYPNPSLFVQFEKTLNMISLPFDEFRGVCKYEKSGFCKKEVKKCQLADCPILRKYFRPF
jgi:hypothetical protein